ncbi:MAG: glutamate--tRNA ligase [Caldithrix sp. RBG_13_44_9]|nr:MAG: glutamate--tRNA ligase [Caldithrix sp. RBG_13_44_9]
MNVKVVTRFAPSPTGFLHVGGARTALFNYLHAKKEQGTFRLRIEDTDLKRSDSDMVQKIFNGLKWLGLGWEGDVVFQGANSQRHQQIAAILLERGWAYRCFCTTKELEVHRENYRYNKYCQKLSAGQIQENLVNGLTYSLRFKVPEGNTSWEDTIHGKITIHNDEIEDFIILRSDQNPIYQLAVVVDDHDMGVNWIIRGDDHISNTPKQILLYQALEWEIPKFSHVPLILGPDKKRLSKRHGAAAIEDYQELGILPGALFNFLALLGWSPPDNREILSPDEILHSFNLQDVSKKSAVFDEKKLAWMNQQYLINSSPDVLFSAITSLWIKAGWLSEESSRSRKEWLLSLINLLKPRAMFLNDFVELARYFFEAPDQFDHKGLHKYFVNEESWKLLDEIRIQLEACNPFTAESIEILIRQSGESKNVPAGKIIHPLRLVLTGRTASPGLFEVMDLLGQQQVLKRLIYFLDNKILLQNIIAGQ